jgi:hypothetical protein
MKLGSLAIPGAGGETEEKNKKDTMDDRVFVCLGTPLDGTRQVWVMTIDKTFEHVTFWEIKKQKNAKQSHYLLPKRIKKGEQKAIEAYLSPTISEEEHKKIKKMREARV